MLRNQENVINENKEYMKEVQEREEQSFKEMLEPLENEMFNKACQMEEKAMLIEQYYSQIAKMQTEVKQLQEEMEELNNKIEKKKVSSEKISLAIKAKNKAMEILEKVCGKNPLIKEIYEIRKDIKQSNLVDETKNKVYEVLDKIIAVLKK